MRTLAMTACFCVFSTVLAAQSVPDFYAQTYPEHALDAQLEARAILQGDEAALDRKTRELIALAVAAQVPCAYCSYAHTTAARVAGATEQEVREAVATAATVRQWSTVLNGMQYDLESFKQEYDALVTATSD